MAEIVATNVVARTVEIVANTLLGFDRLSATGCNSAACYNYYPPPYIPLPILTQKIYHYEWGKSWICHIV